MVLLGACNRGSEEIVKIMKGGENASLKYIALMVPTPKTKEVKMRRLSFLAIIIVAKLCLGIPSPAAGQPQGELRVGLSTLYDQTFHPTWATLYRKQYIEPIYDFIIGVDPEGNFDPSQGLATEWKNSQDLLTWTLTIRDGVKFHNGDPLTLDDIKYTMEQAASDKNNAGSRSDWQAHLAGVQVVGENRLDVKLNKPWPTFLYYLSTLVGSEGMVQPREYIKTKGEETFMKAPVGSGAYKFYEWKEGDYVKLEAVDQHWRVGTPYYKYLTFKLMPEQNTRIAALKTGEIDVAAVGLTQANELKKEGYRVQQKEDGLYVGLMWLQDYRSDLATNNKKVRQALVYAIDKQSIVDHLLMGEGQVVGTAASMFTWSIEYKPYDPPQYDPEKAKELLKEAGYGDGFTIYLYSFVTALPEIKLINEAIAAYWQAIGLEVKILEMDYSAFKPYWTKTKDVPGPAAFTLAWPNRPVYSWRNMYHSEALYSHKKDPALDQLIEAFETETTPEGYKTGARKIMDYVLDNFYGAGICTTHQLFVVGKDVPAWDMGKGVGSFRWEHIGK